MDRLFLIIRDKRTLEVLKREEIPPEQREWPGYADVLLGMYRESRQYDAQLELVEDTADA